MNIKSKSALYYLSIACAMLGVKQSQAAGYATDSNSTAGIATSYAGSAAGSHDISDSFANAANLSDVKSNQLLVGATYLHLGIDTKNNSGPSGPSSTSTTTNAAIPALYIATPMTDDTVFGLAVTSPFGLTTKYDSNWVGRNDGLTSKMATVNINPSIAYAVNNQLSVAVGLQAQYMSLRLTDAILSDYLYQIKGSGWGYGFNLGAKYRFNDQLTFGVGYRSTIKNKLDGSVSSTLPSYSTSHMKSEVNTPESISAGLSYKLNEKLELLYDTTWTRWSRMKNFVVTASTNPTYLSSTTDFNWRDSFKYSLGANYQYSDHLITRVGVAYETDATTSKDRGPRVPGGDRIWTSVGFGYKFCNDSQVDFAYAHLFYKNTKIDLPSRQDGLLPAFKSTNTSSIDAVSISWKYNF